MGVSHGELVSIDREYANLPAVIVDAGEDTAKRFIEFFTAKIRNKNTRKAYARAIRHFFAWCEGGGIGPLLDIEPVHVAAWVETRCKEVSAPTVKQNLAAVRHRVCGHKGTRSCVHAT